MDEETKTLVRLAYQVGFRKGQKEGWENRAVAESNKDDKEKMRALEYSITRDGGVAIADTADALVKTICGMG